MLPKKQRIQRGQFKSSEKRSRLFHSPHLTLRIGGADASGKSRRFSFVVSAKVAKKATIRNLLRRRGYSIVREYLKTTSKDPTPSALYIFFYKKDSQNVTFSELRSEITELLKKTTPSLASLISPSSTQGGSASGGKEVERHKP